MLSVVKDRDAALYEHLFGAISDMVTDLDSATTAIDEDVEALLQNPELMPTMSPDIVNMTVTEMNWYSTKASIKYTTYAEISASIEGSGWEEPSLVMEIEMPKLDMSQLDEIIGAPEPRVMALIQQRVPQKTIPVNGAAMGCILMVCLVGIAAMYIKSLTQDNNPSFTYSSGQTVH